MAPYSRLPRPHGYQGPPPEDDPQFPTKPVFSQGFLSVAFAFAAGIGFIVVYVTIFKIHRFAEIAEKLSEVNLTAGSWWLFGLLGFIIGLVISILYNFLILRRHVIWGLETASES